MSEMSLVLPQSRRIYRAAVSCLFFLQGICFASWASRIPTIQTQLALSDAQLGGVLLALPVGSMLALAFSGWFVTHFGSKKIALTALLSYSLFLICIGLSQNVWTLILSLVFFGVAGNLSNIAINTQAVGVEALYGRNILASFHGLWSLAGFLAAGIGSFMIARSVIPLNHFLLISAVIIVLLALTFSYLLPAETKSKEKTPLFVRPDKSLITLGFVAFCCMICEGTMFDWSGIYFKKVVHAEPESVGAGYTAFMCTMAGGRFVADWVVGRIGFQRTLLFSGILIATGLLISILFPYVLPSIVGFLLVGLGVSSVVPLVYSQAGKSTRVPPGVALASVSSIGFLGFVFGPPLIGMVAGLFSLRISFLIIAAIGLFVAFIAKKL